MSLTRRDSLAGCLLGCAVGDSIALPFEGLSKRRAGRRMTHPLSHSLVFGRGMVSDDTDHTVFVAQSLHIACGDATLFRKALACRLRLWLATLPAGIGFATLRSILLLCLGVSPQSSGVRSAGNGPSMRSAIIGCYYFDDAARRREFVEASTSMTHRDGIALAGATAIAEVAAKLASHQWLERPTVADLVACLRSISAEPQWQQAVDKIGEACNSEQAEQIAALHFGANGVSGYTLHSVPFALVAWYRHFGDFEETINTIVRAGGDTDTIAAIAGALAGITVGRRGIPDRWLNNLVDWPHSVGYLDALASALDDQAVDADAGFRFGLFPRSPVLTVIVLAHGLRRCLPPY
ncbi:MAG: ADP-ribosylglycohydrolase family protein [Betaproteobacteria bacterium]|nr:ADP-ribosylglycohydrolase family protein [Betaproteobacteria bacterium]